MRVCVPLRLRRLAVLGVGVSLAFAAPVFIILMTGYWFGLGRGHAPFDPCFYPVVFGALAGVVYLYFARPTV